MSADHLLPETMGAVVDGELSPADEAAARAHIDLCHTCALKVIAAHQLQLATRRAARGFEPSQEAMARLTALASQQAPKRTRSIPLRSMVWSVAAGLILVAFVFGSWRLLRRSNALTVEMLDAHLSVLSDTSSPEVVSTDRHTVKPWFEGKLPFSFNIPDQNALPADTTLAGADLTYIEGRPAALLLFTIHKHRTSVFVSQSGGLPAFWRPAARSGFKFSEKRAGGLEFVGVSDTNKPELDALVAALAAAQ